MLIFQVTNMSNSLGHDLTYVHKQADFAYKIARKTGINSFVGGGGSKIYIIGVFTEALHAHNHGNISLATIRCQCHPFLCKTTLRCEYVRCLYETNTTVFVVITPIK